MSGYERESTKIEPSRVTITRCQNGWIVESSADGPFVFGSSDDDEVEDFIEVLWEVNAQIGPTTSRWSPKRVSIEVRPGDKWEPEK